MQSLREKLLKAGLVSEEAAKKAETEKQATARPERPAEHRPERGERPPRSFDRPGRNDRAPRSVAGPVRSDGPPRGVDRPNRPPAAARPEARLPKLPPLAGTPAASRQASMAQLALDRKLRDRVLATQVQLEPGATTFHFVTRKNKLRRLELTEAQAKLLQDGKLAVVERPDPDKIEHALVPPEVALELKALSPRTVRFLNMEGEKVGFLSDSEISERAHEAEAGGPEANDHAPERGEAAPGSDTFITIKRSPLGG